MIKLLTFMTLFLFTVSFEAFSSEDHHKDEHSHGESHEESHEDHHGHGGGKAIGEGKALMDVNEKKGFKISPEAIETLGIKTEKMSAELRESALVIDRHLKGFYVLRDGYFKFLEISQLKSLKPEDQVAVEGIGLLRITDVYSTDESEYGHGH